MMTANAVLVDTSVWVRKLAGREPFAGSLDRLLDRRQVAGHELIHGELLIGAHPGRRRDLLLTAYQAIPWLPRIEHVQVEAMVRARQLAGTGLGWIDAHLLASALVANVPLWTADSALMQAVEKFAAGWRVY